MKKLSLNFQHCYGIKSLKVEFDFTKYQTCVIYAPNGSMKTSFAKTFRDFSNGLESKDLIFPERESLREIKDESGTELKPESVFVIEPYNEHFNSDKQSTLLVSKELKDEYDTIYKELDIEKNEFIKKLKTTSQSTDCETELLMAFSPEGKKSIFVILSEILPKLDGKQPKYTFRYNDIFDKKGNVKKFLEKHNTALESYINSYESLISSSTFFKKSNNSFGTHQASELLKSTEDNAFFEAGHILTLNNNVVVSSVEKLKKLVDEEVSRIVNDKKLKTLFDKVDKAIGSNIELRSFKRAIEQNNLLLVELNDYDAFKKKVWVGYLDQLTNEVFSLINLYNRKKQELEEIVLKAKSQITDWEKSIREFNERFNGLPFRLSIQNKEDVILKTNTPSVEFIFKDLIEERGIERKDLLEVLSQGERRALYLLNIIFEVQARKKLNQKTLFVIDDIADSFDYKNKYAIIEYLKDISLVSNFYQIILTHNFDFYRTIFSRLLREDRDACKMVIKTKDQTSVVDASYLKPFEYFKKNLHKNNRILIASIPFVRNLAEYSGHKDKYSKLTSLLHIKSETDTIDISNLEVLFKTILVDKNSLNLTGKNLKVIDLVFKLAEEILAEEIDCLDLESKIVLSIAIRLKAERFLIDCINDQVFVNSIERNQTVHLIDKYKTLACFNSDIALILEQVNLMTPENIHLNSFMYEPIIDLGSDHLKKLYKDVCEKCQN